MPRLGSATLAYEVSIRSSAGITLLRVSRYGIELLKTPVNNVDYNVLLRCGHLNITGQAQAALEDIHAHVHALAGDISVSVGPAVSLSGDKAVHPVDRLHMHGLPDRPALSIVSRQCFQNLSWAAFSGLRDKERLLLSADLGAHGFPVDEQAGEPEIGFAVNFVIGIHSHG